MGEEKVTKYATAVWASIQCHTLAWALSLVTVVSLAEAASHNWQGRIYAAPFLATRATRLSVTRGSRAEGLKRSVTTRAAVLVHFAAQFCISSRSLRLILV